MVALHSTNKRYTSSKLLSSHAKAKTEYSFMKEVLDIRLFKVREENQTENPKKKE